MYISRSWSKILLGLLSFLSVASVDASQIIPVSGQTEVSVINLEDNLVDDFLAIKKSNNSGISVNEFDIFSVKDKPLKILNTSKLFSDKTSRSANIIVIKADDIQLENTIEIVGPLADLIFISEKDNGKITCTGCTINNVYRVSLVVADLYDLDNNSTIDLNKNILKIGTLKSIESGSVHISNLTAKGALGVNIVADTLHLLGAVDTFQKVTKTSQGIYKNDLNGSQTMGGTSFVAALGKVTWDYSTQNLLASEPDGNREKIIFGSIDSTAVRIQASYALNVASKINTKTDLLTSVRYPHWDESEQKYVDKSSVVAEDVTIQTFQNANESKNVKSTVITSPSIESNNSISIRSMSGLILQSSPFSDKSFIKGARVKVIAASKLQNTIEISASLLEIAGENVVNMGILSAREKLQGYAKNNFVNHSGGEIVSASISLQADKGFVRNGSRTPFIIAEAAVSNLLEYNTNSLLMTDAYKIGTFYKIGLTDDFTDPLSSSTNIARGPKDTSAKIVGDNITIKSMAFENINPYWTKVENQNLLELDTLLTAQVGVVAGESLLIQANNYIVNSSSSIQSDGVLKLNSPIVLNERYRVLSILKQDLVTRKDYNQTGFKTEVVAYSPPGLISSTSTESNNIIKAQSGFSNKASYFDIAGNISFLSNAINYYGIDSGAGLSRVLQTIHSKRRYRCRKGLWIAMCTKRRTRVDQALSVVSPQRLDAVFSIGGDAYGRNFSVDKNNKVVVGEPTNVNIKAINSFGAYVDEIIEGMFRSNSSASYTYNRKILSANTYNKVKSVNYKTNTITTSENYNQKIGEGKVWVPIDVGGITIFVRAKVDITTKKTRTINHNLIDKFKAFFASIASAVSEWVSKLNLSTDLMGNK